jgi:hypothetical protein
MGVVVLNVLWLSLQGGKEVVSLTNQLLCKPDNVWTHLVGRPVIFLGPRSLPLHPWHTQTNPRYGLHSYSRHEKKNTTNKQKTKGQAKSYFKKAPRLMCHVIRKRQGGWCWFFWEQLFVIGFGSSSESARKHVPTLWWLKPWGKWFCWCVGSSGTTVDSHAVFPVHLKDGDGAQHGSLTFLPLHYSFWKDDVSWWDTEGQGPLTICVDLCAWLRCSWASDPLKTLSG